MTDKNALTQALLRYALEQLELTKKQLQRRPPQIHTGVHEARKATRKARSILRLIASDSDDAVAIEQGLRRVVKSLSKLRDANVVAEKASAQKGWAEVAPVLTAMRNELRARREAVLCAVLEADPAFAARRKAIGRLQARLSDFAAPPVTTEQVLLALRRSASKATKAQKRSSAAPTAILLHRSRRRLRRLRMQLQALEWAASEKSLPRRVRADAKWVLAEAADSMPSVAELSARADTLGTRQDRSLLRNAVRRELTSPLREAALAVLTAKEKKG